MSFVSGIKSFDEVSSDDAPFRIRLTVIGLGGAGGNAVANMINTKLEGVKFVVANTDMQSLNVSPCANKIQIGKAATCGLGAGAKPEIGRQAAMESSEEIIHHIGESDILFITAGMGGGTGTGAAEVVAKLAREKGILTVAVVTKPFDFEGNGRLEVAKHGIVELEKYVDTMIVVSNENLFRIANESTSFSDAFRIADDVLYSGVKCITDLITMPGLINLDFADIKTIMLDAGRAMIGSGEAAGPNRAISAVEMAITNPLLENNSITGASGLLVNITGGDSMTLFEVSDVVNRVSEKISSDTKLIFGSIFNDAMNDTIRVSVVATGVDGLRSRAKAAMEAVTTTQISNGKTASQPRTLSELRQFMLQGEQQSSDHSVVQDTAPNQTLATEPTETTTNAVHTCKRQYIDTGADVVEPAASSTKLRSARVLEREGLEDLEMELMKVNAGSGNHFPSSAPLVPSRAAMINVVSNRYLNHVNDHGDQASFTPSHHELDHVADMNTGDNDAQVFTDASDMMNGRLGRVPASSLGNKGGAITEDSFNNVADEDNKAAKGFWDLLGDTFFKRGAHLEKKKIRAPNTGIIVGSTTASNNDDSRFQGAKCDSDVPDVIHDDQDALRSSTLRRKRHKIDNRQESSNLQPVEGRYINDIKAQEVVDDECVVLSVFGSDDYVYHKSNSTES